MSRENVEVVRRVYDAAIRRDAEGLLELYDPEVELDDSRTPPGELSGGRVFRGREGVREAFRKYHEAWESIEDDCEELIDAGEHVISVVTSRGRGRASGAEVERTHYGVWTIRQGKIARVVWFATRHEALEATRRRD